MKMSPIYILSGTCHFLNSMQNEVPFVLNIPSVSTIADKMPLRTVGGHLWGVRCAGMYLL